MKQEITPSLAFPDYFKSELMETQGISRFSLRFSFPDYFKSELMETERSLSPLITATTSLSRLLQIGINGNQKIVPETVLIIEIT